MISESGSVPAANRTFALLSFSIFFRYGGAYMTAIDRTDPQQLLRRLKEANVWSKKHLGQHFLLDSKVLDLTLEKAGIAPDEQIIEVGPGLGTLTERLLAKTSRLAVFEYDPDMVKILEKDFPGLEIIAGDVLRTAPEYVNKLGDYKVVANIPYQITTPLLRLFLENPAINRPQSMTLLVQKEVGKRLAAPAATSGRGYLSVLAQYFAEVTYVCDVPAVSFWPAPQVNSSVIHLELRDTLPLQPEAQERFLRLVHQLFIQPRKQLKNVLGGILGVSASEVEEYFAQFGWKSALRAQEVTQEQWLAIFNNPFSKA
jgi:16S rRNA (adenine1518-N6/adenine1519-N6)-dimethyltransferase